MACISESISSCDKTSFIAAPPNHFNDRYFANKGEIPLGNPDLGKNKEQPARGGLT
jgi:hypothetical protein